MNSMPYYKYGNWYVPGYNIQFESDTEAWNYIESK